MILDAGLTPLSYSGRKHLQINPAPKKPAELDTSLKAYEEAKTQQERDAIRRVWQDQAERERARDRMHIC